MTSFRITTIATAFVSFALSRFILFNVFFRIYPHGHQLVRLVCIFSTILFFKSFGFWFLPRWVITLLCVVIVYYTIRSIVVFAMFAEFFLSRWHRIMFVFDVCVFVVLFGLTFWFACAGFGLWRVASSLMSPKKSTSESKLYWYRFLPVRCNFFQNSGMALKTMDLISWLLKLCLPLLDAENATVSCYSWWAYWPNLSPKCFCESEI